MVIICLGIATFALSLAVIAQGIVIHMIRQDVENIWQQTQQLKRSQSRIERGLSPRQSADAERETLCRRILS